MSGLELQEGDVNLKETDIEPGELSLEEAPIKWILNLGDLSHEGLEGEKCAEDKELVLVTQFLDDGHDLEVLSLCCSFRVKPKKMAAWKNVEGFRGHFRLFARLKQTCVVSLEPVETIVEEEFIQDFISASGPRPKSIRSRMRRRILLLRNPQSS